MRPAGFTRSHGHLSSQEQGHLLANRFSVSGGLIAAEWRLQALPLRRARTSGWLIAVRDPSAAERELKTGREPVSASGQRCPATAHQDPTMQ